MHACNMITKPVSARRRARFASVRSLGLSEGGSVVVDANRTRGSGSSGSLFLILSPSTFPFRLLSLLISSHHLPSSSLSTTLPRIRPTTQRLRENTSSSQILHMPLRRTLRLPRPKNPPGMRFIRIQLRINKTRQILLISIAQILHRARVFPIAGTNVRRAGKSTVIARSFSKPVEPFRTVGLRACPFADYGPFVGAGESGAESACCGDVLRGGHGDLSWGKDLVLMGVEEDILVTGRGVEFAVPVTLDVFEGVVDGGAVV